MSTEKTTQSTFNFSGVKATEGNTSFEEYLLPGMYMLKPYKCEFGRSATKETAYMELTFICESKNENFNGKIAKDKFYITEKTMPRLQTLHVGLTGKETDKAFKSVEEVYTYFEKLMSPEYAERFKKPMLVGANLSLDGKKMFSSFPYTFFVAEENFEEMEFEQNSARWKAVITSKNKVYDPSSADISSDDAIVSSNVADDDSLPF